MGVLSELALGGVDRVERGLGARAALRALVPLLDSLGSLERSRATVRALRYALELDDKKQLSSLTARWRADKLGAHKPIRLAVRSLLTAGEQGYAEHIATAEAERTAGRYDDASAQYLLGRSVEPRDPALALSAYVRAQRLAREQPRLSRAAEVRAIRQLLRLGRRLEAADRAGRLLPYEKGAAADRLALAVAGLGARGRYRRAAALDVLEELSARNDTLASAAQLAAAQHAERSNGLSEIELDRALAVLAHHVDGEAAGARLVALAELARQPLRAARADPESEAFVMRARAVLDDHAAGPPPEGSARAEIGWLGLAALAAVRAERPTDAAAKLATARARIDAGDRVEAVLWSAALRAYPKSPVAARELMAVLLTSIRDEPPPRGYVDVGDTLLRHDALDLAVHAYRAAHQTREKGAPKKLAELLRWLGWRAEEVGDAERAIEYLREARALFEG